MRPEILPTHTAALFDAAVERAVALLRAGEIVALPTETVYGLSANAFDPAAVEKIYQAKGRPAHNPIIVHVASYAMAVECVAHWPESAQKLAKSFWPGPLTMVLPKSARIPQIVTAGGNTVGVRWPSHPLMQAVIAKCGFPLAAPSANRSNEISPTTAEHVRKSLGDAVPLIVDGGAANVGIESTVVDLASERPRILRPGMIHEESLSAALGDLLVNGESSGGALRSPGMLPKHYAPKAKLVVLDWNSAEQLRSQIRDLKYQSADVWVIAHTEIPLQHDWRQVSVIPHDAEAFARALYAELHRCDEEGAKLIVVEALPDDAAWRGIADRLARAAAAES
ncbi:MAG: Threonylcarbamoyl-AMP synthase [Verrucomicrobiales bacterium]|nr:Threonylcarbamoyl-AMP synthase [Verrucomicrobiales bacterium]